MIDVLLEVLRLKELRRTGWVRRGVPDPESVAGHTFGVAWLVLVLLPDELDLGLALTYAVLHDVPECRVGDLTPHDGVVDKAEREHAAMIALCAGLPRGPRLRSAWEAYERQEDPEARFVRQLDRLDMALQAVAYAGPELDLTEFQVSAAAVVSDPALQDLLSKLRERLTEQVRGQG